MCMNILYTCDNNYVWQMGISLVSLFESHPNKKINIYLICTGLSEVNKEKLNELVDKYSQNIRYIDLSELSLCPILKSNGRWPLICYARLFAYKVLKDVNRLLYLDCDTVVLSNIESLFSDKYSSFPIYGAKDFIGDYYKKLIGMSKNSVNINGGVILFNLNLYKELNPDDKIISFLKDYGKRISYADQDVLNGTFWREFGFLDAKYDVMSIMKCFSYSEILKLKHPTACYTKKEVDEASHSPCIIHYTGNYRFKRPWFHNSNHPYKNYFDYYKKLSPWKDLILQDSQIESKEIVIANKIRKLPSWFSCSLLGFFYCYIRPAKIWIMSIIK